MIASIYSDGMLFSAPTLTTVDRQVLDEIDSMRAELRHRVRAPQKWTEGLRKS